MRRALTIAAVSIMLASTSAATAQQPTPPAPPVQPTAPAPTTAKPAAQPPKTGHAAWVRRRHTGYVVRRHRHGGICSIVNGWRAFNNPYDPKGYFYTGRVCCCG